MKIPGFFYIPLLFFISCKSHDNNVASREITTIDSSITKKENPIFFPVTSYLKGQISGIKNGGINPLKFVTVNSHTDSIWLKMENLDDEFSDFLAPEIDSVNLIALFSEKKFFDQTLDAVTLTYDPIKTLPDTFALRHWDVYIDPNSNTVRRIYFLKELPGKRIKQLSWASDKSCTITTIADDANGKSSVVKKVFIKWVF